MWIGVQILIFIALVSISFIMPKNLYCFLVGMGVIFTIFAVFVNWLLAIQLINIMISAALGLKVIEIRDRYFKTIYMKLMKIATSSNGFRILQDSKMPMITIICSIIIVLLYFWNFGIIDGEFVSSFSIMPFKWYRYNKFSNILLYIKFIGDVLLLYFVCSYKKRNIEILIIPAIIKVAYYVLYEIYLVIIGYSYNITKNLFLVISFVTIFIMVLLVMNNTIKNKSVIFIGFLVLIGSAIALCIKQKYPFVYDYGIVDLSLLTYFIAYCIGYLALVLSLDTKEME